MRNMLLAFLYTIVITFIFSLTGQSLIIMYLILLTQSYFIIKTYKENKKEKKQQVEEPLKPVETKSYNNQKIIKPSYTKCKEKVKIKKLEHKR